MRSKLIMFIVLLPFFVSAQIVKERDVIASGGNSTPSGNLQIDFTIAELSVDLLSSGYLMLSQGYNQPSDFYLALPEKNPEAAYRIFPNPVVDWANISIPRSFTSSNISVVDLLGRTMPGSSIDLPADHADIIRIDCSSYPPGVYSIRLIQTETNRKINYKLIKTN